MSPANKEIEPIEKGWAELTALVETLGEPGLELTGAGRWAVKDHLVHIAAWERSLLGLLNGEDIRTAMGVPGAAEDTDALNEAVWLAHRHETSDQALAFWRDTHAELMELGGRYRTMFDLQAQRFAAGQPVDEDDEEVVFDVLS